MANIAKDPTLGDPVDDYQMTLIIVSIF